MAVTKKPTPAQALTSSVGGTATPTATTVPPTTSNTLPSTSTLASSSLAPTSSTSLFNLGQSGTIPLAGDNTDVLGPDNVKGKGGNPTRRTILDAVQALTTMSPSQVSTIQAALVRAGILTGKYRAGTADSSTVTAWSNAVKDATREGQSISTYINAEGAAQGTSSSAVLGTSGGSGSAPAKPSYADPAQIVAELENQAQTQGVTLTQANVNNFGKQIRAAENAKPGNDTNVDVTSEAQLFVQNLASKSGATAPGSQKLTQSTDADITKAAAAMGVQLSPTARNNIAQTVDANTKATGSADENLVSQLVAKQFKMPTDPSTLSGDAATVFQDLQGIAGKYLLNLGNQTLGSWVQKAIQNQSYAGSLVGDTEAEFTTWAKQQAATNTPWLAKATDNFSTTDPFTATSGIRSAISDTLDLGDPDTVNLASPKYASLLNSPDGVNAPNLANIRQTLMTDPQYGYSNTPLAKQQAYTLGIKLLNGLGVSVGGV